MADSAADWEPLRESLRRRRAAARAMGGPEKLARYRAGGRWDARERIARLVAPVRVV